MVFSIPFLLILTFKSRIYLDFHSRLQSYRTLIVTTSFVCTPYQKNAPQISQTETLIYLGPVLNALPIKKNARQISASIDNDLFLTSFACTPYQKDHLKFNKTQNQRGREANDCVVPLTRYHFSFLTSIPFPSILLVSKYSFLFFYWILSFSLFLFSYIPFLLIVVYLILDFFQIFIAVIQKLQFRNEPE